MSLVGRQARRLETTLQLTSVSVSKQSRILCQRFESREPIGFRLERGGRELCFAVWYTRSNAVAVAAGNSRGSTRITPCYPCPFSIFTLSPHSQLGAGMGNSDPSQCRADIHLRGSLERRIHVFVPQGSVPQTPSAYTQLVQLCSHVLGPR